MAITTGNLGTALAAAALSVVLVSEISDMSRSYRGMTAMTKSQASALAAAGKSETQLTALAKGVQTLAQAGNPNAQTIIAVLKRNGVNIDPTTPRPSRASGDASAGR